MYSGTAPLIEEPSTIYSFHTPSVHQINVVLVFTTEPVAGAFLAKIGVCTPEQADMLGRDVPLVVQSGPLRGHMPDPANALAGRFNNEPFSLSFETAQKADMPVNGADGVVVFMVIDPASGTFATNLLEMAQDEMLMSGRTGKALPSIKVATVYCHFEEQ
ncbi:hypothetical protein FOA52_015842 [Chlamydomonas sp. UWO 241]|nr:hypothetical protein FOA52_015842 [Chlamydomonas sp. UWO 241]